MRLKGASKGLAALLLYLSSPEKYSVWVDKTYDGLSILGRIAHSKNVKWGARYVPFNGAAHEFAQSYSIDASELDWILSFLGRSVKTSSYGKYKIDDDVLKGHIQVLGKDEPDHTYGERMNLGLMHWMPTNEMGVVALFIEFREALGFPEVDYIRP